MTDEDKEFYEEQIESLKKDLTDSNRKHLQAKTKRVLKFYQKKIIENATI